jgi:hypothetical protein
MLRALPLICIQLVLLSRLVYGVSVIPTEGLVLHLDAGSVEGVADGSQLTAGWLDQSLSGLVAASANPPTYVLDAGSGYPAVRFDGAEQYLEVSLATSAEASVFIVFAHQRQTGSKNYRDTLMTATGSGISLYLASSLSSEIAPDYPSFNAVPGPGVTVETWVNGLNTADVTGDLFPGRYYVGSAIYTALPSREALLIGSRGTGGFNAGQNDIREILIFDRALSDEEREAVQQFLGNKYDIGLAGTSLGAPVEAYPHVLGSQQFGTHYSFGESGISTVDFARATLRQGNRVVKFRLSRKYASEDGFTEVAGINTLAELVRDQPEVKTILDMPLTDYLFWVASFQYPSWQNQLDDNGLKPNVQTAIYNEVYDLVVYLLQTYSGSGKRFYLGNWEGDWMLAGTYRDDPTKIPQNRIQGMIDWARIRQQAVDDAKANIPHSGVEVWFYLEMNKADWMREGLPCLANTVIPALPKLDMISISSYSIHKDKWGGRRNASLMHADLDQVQALIDAKPDTTIEGSRIIIGEYGYIYEPNRYSNSLEEFAHNHRLTARNFLSWQGGTLRFVLSWQFFNQALKNNGDSKEMSQIGPNNDRRPLYYLYENFYRFMRRWLYDHYSRTGELPSERAYMDQAVYVLEVLMDGAEPMALSEYEPALNFANYNSWKAFNFPDAIESADASVSGPLADAYQSGIANLMRYALGLSKFDSFVSHLPRIQWQHSTTQFVMPFDSRKTDLRWRVETSSTFHNWTPSVFDSFVDSPTVRDGWIEIFLDVQDWSTGPQFYRLNLELIP